jgi:predicted ribosomally synthesized peptide with nif11-like leader
MSLQSANEFISTATSNAELMAKVTQAVAGKSPTDAAQAVSDLGRLNGFEFTADEALQARQAVLQSQNLSEDDLDRVAGGRGLIATAPVGGGFVSPESAVFPQNETKPAPSFPGGGGVLGTSPVGGGFVSSGIALPPNETKPAPPFPGGVIASW